MHIAKPVSYCRTGFSSNLHNLLYYLVRLVRYMTDIGKDIEKAGDKMKAGAKAAGEKMKDAGDEVKTEYNKEKVKEKLD